MKLRIDALAAGGRGVAREAGKVWFVAGGLPGDLVRVEVVRERERFGEARLLERLESGSERRAAPCPIQQRCGGCPWMPLPIEAQRRWKATLVEEALNRIGGLSQPPIAPLRAGRRELGYRNRIELRAEHRGGGWSIGYAAPGRPETTVDTEACPLQHPDGDELLAALRDELERGVRSRGRSRLLLRRAESSGELLLGWDAGFMPPDEERRLARRLLERLERLVGVVRIDRPPRGRGGTRVEPIAGRGSLTETIAGSPVELPATTFAQVNEEVAGLLRDHVVERLQLAPETTLWDLYGGVGGYAIAAAGRGASVTVCEADALAVACGRAATESLDVRYVRATVERFVEQHAGDPPQRIVANPPRAGIGTPTVRRLVALGAPRWVIVSCDPATLARDLAAAVEGGYRVEQVVPFDMFPQTAHVECVATLVR